MAADLSELLREAAAAPPRELDVEEVLIAGARRRRRRRAQRAGGLAAIALLAVAGVLGVVASLAPRVDLASPDPGPTWPLAVRYEVTTTREDRTHERVVELAANGWDDWAFVSDLGDGRVGVERHGPGLRDSAGDVGGSDLLATPFAALEAAATAQLLSDDGEPMGRVPGPLLGPGQSRLMGGHHPDGAVVSDDLPELREEIAERLSLDPSVLRSGRIEGEGCDGGGCGRWSRTAVWLSGIDVPLHAEEVDPDGSSQRFVATHLRQGVAPPPNPVPAPPPRDPDVDPSAPTAPIEAGGLRWEGTSTLFELGKGSRVQLEVTTIAERPTAVPDGLTLARWDGERWHDLAALPLRWSTAHRGVDEAPGAQPPAPVQEPGPGPIVIEPGRRAALEVPLPDEADPGAHRLSTPEGEVVARFWYVGDPNRHVEETEPPP